jgi:hypothetical protein
VGLDGSAVRSSRGPEGVGMIVRVMPLGNGVGRGGLGVGARHWRAKGPKGIVEMGFGNEKMDVGKEVVWTRLQVSDR